MRNQIIVLGLLFIVTAGGSAPAGAPPTGGKAAPGADPQRIEKLIKQLGSPRYRDRETAARELDAIGLPALEQLRQALKSADPEISVRAGKLVRKLEEQILMTTLLTPKRVRLKLQDATVPQA